MKHRLTHLVLAVFLLATVAAPALADIALPKENKNKSLKKPAITSPLKITPDEGAKEAKLVIPREVLQQMMAGLDDSNSQNAALSGQAYNFGNTQTVMSGIFLSLAFAFGGVWLLRSRKRAAGLGPATLCVGLMALGCAFAGAAYANAGPPPIARSLTSKILIDDLQWWGAYGRVNVEVSNDASQITLVLPKAKKEQTK